MTEAGLVKRVRAAYQKIMAGKSLPDFAQDNFNALSAGTSN